MSKTAAALSKDEMLEIGQKASPDWVVADEAEDLYALPEKLGELPEWLQDPLRRFLRLKQRNWPAKTVQRSTRQIFNRMNKMVTFFIQNYDWSAWDQLSTTWIEDYIDARLKEGKAPGTINWDMINLRVFCQFVMDEGYPVPNSVLKVKLLEKPRRLPRPLTQEQVLCLEEAIQNAVSEAKSDRKMVLAVRDLACFYLLWHCGLRISEVCSLLLPDLDISARKILIRNSKERKDRVIYISEAVVLALQQYLAIREKQAAIPLFITRGGGMMTPRTLQRRLAYYGKICEVPVTAHRLRHTFASQMLAVGMPVTSLQRFLGHEHLDTTMIYAEVADTVLQQDYYRGISVLDSGSMKMGDKKQGGIQQDTLRQLILELKTESVSEQRREEILDQMQRLLEEHNTAAGG